MKVVALREHECYCCGGTIKKGEECFALFVYSSEPKNREYDVIYTCSKCINEETCKTKIGKRKTS
ncbi:MAG: hypothetical protein QHH24_00995 [Candidatus Bathyarchaeota archaeon]|jgi:hypothetical protein|nr:hypothetical protein [Candidatus Bathyarchaeota archaeon]